MFSMSQQPTAYAENTLQHKTGGRKKAMKRHNKRYSSDTFKKRFDNRNRKIKSWNDRMAEKEEEFNDIKLRLAELSKSTFDQNISTGITGLFYMEQAKRLAIRKDVKRKLMTEITKLRCALCNKDPLDYGSELQRILIDISMDEIMSSCIQNLKM